MAIDMVLAQMSGTKPSRVAGDRSLNWINSLMVEGADDGKVSAERTKVKGMKGHVVVHATHPCLMRNRRVVALTLAFLKSGQFPTEKH